MSPFAAVFLTCGHKIKYAELPSEQIPSAIERLYIIHRQNALESVEGTQSLISIKQFLPLLRHHR